MASTRRVPQVSLELMLTRRLSRSLSHKVLSYPVPNGLLLSTPSCHVTLTSRTWSSLLGMTRICMPVLLLKTWPGEKGWSRGMGRPLCSPLAVECRLPLLLMLLLSACSSTFLSTDRLSFSIQLSVWKQRQKKRSFILPIDSNRSFQSSNSQLNTCSQLPIISAEVHTSGQHQM